MLFHNTGILFPSQISIQRCSGETSEKGTKQAHQTAHMDQ